MGKGAWEERYSEDSDAGSLGPLKDSRPSTQNLDDPLRDELSKPIESEPASSQQYSKAGTAARKFAVEAVGATCFAVLLVYAGLCFAYNVPLRPEATAFIMSPAKATQKFFFPDKKEPSVDLESLPPSMDVKPSNFDTPSPPVPIVTTASPPMTTAPSKGTGESSWGSWNPFRSPSKTGTVNPPEPTAHEPPSPPPTASRPAPAVPPVKPVKTEETTLAPNPKAVSTPNPFPTTDKDFQTCFEEQLTKMSAPKQKNTITKNANGSFTIKSTPTDATHPPLPDMNIDPSRKVSASTTSVTTPAGREALATQMLAAYIAAGNTAPGIVNLKCSNPEITQVLEKKFKEHGFSPSKPAAEPSKLTPPTPEPASESKLTPTTPT